MECTTYIYHLTDYVTINVNIDTYMSQMILIALEARGANPFQSNNNFYLNILINFIFVYCEITIAINSYLIILCGNTI